MKLQKEVLKQYIIGQASQPAEAATSALRTASKFHNLILYENSFVTSDIYGILISFFIHQQRKKVLLSSDSQQRTELSE